MKLLYNLNVEALGRKLINFDQIAITLINKKFEVLLHNLINQW